VRVLAQRRNEFIRWLLFIAEGCGANINDYCSLDMEGGKPVSQMTLGEKEQAFLEALSVRGIPCLLRLIGN